MLCNKKEDIEVFCCPFAGVSVSGELARKDAYFGESRFSP
jgi:hypothetical protein